MTRGTGHRLCMLCTVLCLLGVAWPACAEDLTARVRETHARMKTLERAYLETELLTQKAAVAAEMLKQATWLVQVGGLAEARDDALAALTRLAAAGVKRPLYYAFVADAQGRTQAQMTLRCPDKAQTPGALGAYAERLFFVQVSAHGTAWEMPKGLYAVPARALGELRPVLPLHGDKLPEDLKPYQAFFDFPQRLEAGRSWEGLVLLPEPVRKTALLGVMLQPVGHGAENVEPAAVRHLRVSRDEVADPPSYERAVLRVQRLEARYQMERREREAERLPVDKPQAADAADADVPDEQDEKLEGELKSVGVVEKAGNDAMVQVRLDWKSKFKPGDILHVRKKGRWIGKVKLPDELSTTNRNVLFTDILDGIRENMAGGTLHRARH